MKHHINLLRLELLFELLNPTVVRDYSYYIVTYNLPVPVIPHILKRPSAYPCYIFEVRCDLTHLEIIICDHKSEGGVSVWVIEHFYPLVRLKHEDHVAVAQAVDEQIGEDGEDGAVPYLHIVVSLVLDHARLACT